MPSIADFFQGSAFGSFAEVGPLRSPCFPRHPEPIPTPHVLRLYPGRPLTVALATRQLNLQSQLGLAVRSPGVMSTAIHLHAASGLLTLRRCQLRLPAHVKASSVTRRAQRSSLAHSSARCFSSSHLLAAAAEKQTSSDRYAKAPWIKHMESRKEHQNRDLTDAEKAAFLEQRKKRMEQLGTAYHSPWLFTTIELHFEPMRNLPPQKCHFLYVF